MNTFNPFFWPRFLILKLIKIYQKTLSPDHGLFRATHPYGYCRFEPTCSQYSYEAVAKYGLLKGAWLGSRRLLRCHPWSQGGHDPVK